MTEQSDQPNDTPDFDRFSDLNMGTITPAKIDKNLRYAKTAAQNHSKKHLSGRGEIFRPPREYTALRKRKRLNGDRDVGSLKYHSSRDDSSYSDADDSDTQRPGSRSRRSKKKDAKKTSWMASIFDIINQHPNLPDNLKRWVSFLVNVSVVSAVGYWVWAIVSTVRGDIMTANSAARREIVAKAASCQTQYEINGCEGNDRPALQAMCEQWDECRYLDPESIMVVRNTAKEVAGVFNAFATTMEYRSYVGCRLPISRQRRRADNLPVPALRHLFPLFRSQLLGRLQQPPQGLDTGAPNAGSRSRAALWISRTLQPGVHVRPHRDAVAPEADRRAGHGRDRHGWRPLPSAQNHSAAPANTFATPLSLGKGGSQEPGQGWTESIQGVLGGCCPTDLLFFFFVLYRVTPGGRTSV